MRKRLLSLLFLSLYGSMLFAQEPLDINDVERVPLGDFTYQWRNIYDRTPLHGKCRIILSYRSYTIAHFNKDGILDGLYVFHMREKQDKTAASDCKISCYKYLIYS